MGIFMSRTTSSDSRFVFWLTPLTKLTQPLTDATARARHLGHAHARHRDDHARAWHRHGHPVPLDLHDDPNAIEELAGMQDGWYTTRGGAG
jgi:hypothetical protein